MVALPAQAEIDESLKQSIEISFESEYPKLDALYKNGDGPTIMVRTELDALPMEEKTGLPIPLLRSRLSRNVDSRSRRDNGLQKLPCENWQFYYIAFSCIIVIRRRLSWPHLRLIAATRHPSSANLGCISPTWQKRYVN
ncbi:hypothetical protein V1283_002378 [Bradyrhizobium sp. AZCC 2262]|uniref:hypothetical protein n=1 Tax=Bradyrhizobium sp. AZCC 2262 TaxID=3117022 RepID=UPI002FEEDF6E